MGSPRLCSADSSTTTQHEMNLKMTTTSTPAEIRNLAPATLWSSFADLNEVPRASKQEQQVIEFVSKFGEGLGLETHVDAAGNVLIRKPGTAGREGSPAVALQSHLDMVHQKNSDCDFDFATQGIEMIVDDDWVMANGTTLGADNGIGVAAMMALLAAQDLQHPPLECLFTIDEETGMTGAKNLQPGWLQSKVLLNLDTEDDTELTIGCAGGVDVTLTAEFAEQQPDPSSQWCEIRVSGLTGGHSGMDIHLGRGNANKIMNRLLWAAAELGAQVARIDGGGLRNAIPRESQALIAMPNERQSDLKTLLESLGQQIRQEQKTTDPDLQLQFDFAAAAGNSVLAGAVQRRLLATLYSCPNGIYRMSPDVEGLVQTSNNLARVKAMEGQVVVGCLTRSSVDSERDDLARAIAAGFGLFDGEHVSNFDIQLSGSYPGWQPAPGAHIVSLMTELYREKFGEQPHVSACHAGLECGIIGAHYPEMEMISFGPNIRGAHSPDEKVQISSVQKFWGFLCDTLAKME